VLAVGDENEKVVNLPVRPDLGFGPGDTATSVVSTEQVGLEPLFRVTVNGEVPPDQLTFATTVAVWPWSSPGGESEMTGNKAGVTVTVALAQAVSTGLPTLLSEMSTEYW
jgi:hypothetical protein